VTGAVALAAGITVLVVLVLSGAGRAWRVTLVAPFWAGALGILQARGHT